MKQGMNHSTSKTSIYSLLASVALERLVIVESIHSETETVYSKVNAIVSDQTESVEIELLLQLDDHLNRLMKSLIHKEIYIEGIMDIIDMTLIKSDLC